MWERRGLKTATSFFLRAGQTWRVSQGLPRAGNEAGILHDKNDWSYGDGKPAPVTPKQKYWAHRREVQRKRITHLLETTKYVIEKPTPILPKIEYTRKKVEDK